MADLREALIAIEQFRPTLGDNDPYQQIAVFAKDTARKALAAHPPDESEKQLARVRALAVDWDKGGFPAWTFARDLRVALADPKPSTDPGPQG